MIAINIGSLTANAPRAINTTPIIKTIIEENAEILLNLEINPVIPNAIIINPIIQNWNPTKNERASKKKINPIPRITVIAPIAKATIENGIS